MEIKLLSGALGAEITGIDLKDTSDQNIKEINNLLLEHKVIFFRDQKINAEQHIALAEKFGPLETHAYVKGLSKHPEIVRIIKAEDEKNQWGENWHSDVSYNEKPTKAVILKSIKIPPVGGDTMFSNMELAYDTLDEKIKDKIKDKKAIHSSLGAAAFVEAYKAMEGNGNIYLNIDKQQNSIVIKVKDNGKGIPSSIQKTIFQPGFTTKDRGWGLGLSLAKRIVEGHHNGKIYISSSKKGVGTVIEITLPSSK